jgi:hypothetical protein
MTTVIVAIIGGVFGLATIWLQARVHRDNRIDHASTAAAVERLAVGHEQLLSGQDEIKADLREVKADMRDHSARLRIVEAEPAPAPKRKRTAS